MKRSLAILLSLLFLLQAAFLPAAAEEPTASDVPQLETADAVIAFIRGELVGRSAELRFKADDQAVAGLTLASICAHTGTGTEGDYLRLSLNYALPQIVKGADDVYVMRPVYYTTAAQEAAVGDYVETVLAGCTAEDDAQTAQYLYDYLCKNVTFDLENLYNDEDLLKYTAYGAAVNGRAVCQGFATLYYRLALAAGLECRIVTGKRGDVAHAWNIVKIGDQWYHLDASSGAQLLDSSAYFMKRLFDGYTIRYGDETAAEIRGYSFVIGNEGENIQTGTLNGELNYGYNDSIVWRLNMNTGALVITGTGEMPTILFQNGTPFWNNTNIKSAVISEGITNIADYLFNGCSNLAEISIPSTVASIGSSSFTMCPIESIYLGEGNPVYCLRGNCLIHIANKTLLLGTSNSVIPNDGSVETIASYAFYKRQGLQRMILPDGLKRIGPLAFYECTGLKELYIPASVTSIDNKAFYMCTALETLTFSETVDTYLNISAGYNFYGCSKLTQISFPKGTYKIGPYAFADCTELKHLSIPKETSSIDPYAFDYCGKLESITVDSENVKYHSDNNCLIETEAKKLIAGCYNSVIPDDGSVTQIGVGAFSGCEALTSIDLPDCLLSIGGFRDCTGLTQITIPVGVSAVQYAFNGCTGLTEITIPENLKMISDSFNDCTGVTELNFMSGVTEIRDSFNRCTGLTTVSFPDTLTFLHGFSDCSNLTNIAFSEGLKKLSGFNNCKNLSSINIPGTVTDIGNIALGYAAFDGCTGLVSLEIPDGVENIKGFSTCTSLTSVIIPETVSCFQSSFSRCNNLKSVTFLSKTVYIEGFQNTPCTIYGFVGSTAETFAQENNKPFIPLCSATDAPHNTQEFDATEPDCLNPGFTAGKVCKDCGEWLSGHEINADALGHDPGDPAPENVVAATCTAEGSYDNVTRCTRCGIVLTSTAEKIAMIPHADDDHNGYCDDCGAYICEHPVTELQNAKEATCTVSGYSGDTVCGWCGVTITYGVTLPASGHQPSISVPAKSATCLDTGMTEEVTCTACGDVITAAQPTPLADHTDSDGDGLCDLCLAPTDCTQYGRCGDELFWYVENGVLVISGSGASGTLDTTPWESCSASIDCVYLKDSVTAMDGARFAACPQLDYVFAPAGADVSNCASPVLCYSDANGVVTVSGRDSAPAMDLPALLNTVSVFCIDRTVAALCFEQLSLCATDGEEEIVYDILKNGKIIDENHFRVPSGVQLNAFSMKPLSYASFNSAFTSLVEHPDRTLILSLSCDDLLLENLKSDSQSYTEQFVLHFVDEPEKPVEPNSPGVETTPMQRIVERFHATLAAILSLFKKLFRLFR